MFLALASILFDFIFSVVQSDLFLSVLEYNLKEIAYAADVAQLGYVFMCLCSFSWIGFCVC